MYKDNPALARDLSAAVKTLRQGNNEVMQAFSGLAQAATKEGTLNGKTKEFIALAMGIAAHCDGCITFHAKALVDQGATRDEVLETLGIAVYMGGGPSAMYAAQALEAFDQFVEEKKKENG